MAKKISISIERVAAHMTPNQRAEYLTKKSRPNKGTVSDILTFPHYYSAKQLEWGEHGPEVHDDNAYLSVYHFLEYEGIDPHEYDTLAIGGRLSELTSDFYQCKYVRDPYTINKYEYNFLKEKQETFKNFKVK